jgi:septal ring factor EnvC (AmiA/AmiB activator)
MGYGIADPTSAGSPSHTRREPMPDRLEVTAWTGLLAAFGAAWKWFSVRRTREADLDETQAKALNTSWEAQGLAIKILEERLSSLRRDCSEQSEEIRDLRLRLKELEAVNENLSRRLSECERRWELRDRRRSERTT